MCPLAPAWPWSSRLTSCEPCEVQLALISPLLGSQPGEAAPREVLVSSASRGLAPREGLGLLLLLLLLKLGHTRPSMDTAVGHRQASLGTPIPRTPTLLLHLDLFET